ncbi:MAG: GTPase HflX [Planctomycetota bacterium]|nr:MAG: GTPase HflX [Planctomycetota bacterium]
MAINRERTDLKVSRERAALAAVHLPSTRVDERDPLGELRALAENAGATVVGELIQRRDRPEAGTYMGSGKLEELRRLCEEARATLVIFDHDLSPAQIGNIERRLERKVIDRSELILDIFAGRATTHEAKLQVELAQLEYTYPRLRAMWDHLERIVGVGGVGGIGTRGPGEQQLEVDRRLVQRRRTRLKRELDAIQARRARQVRERKVDHVLVGLVGYTNAGKSTLFNRLTEGGAYADDRVFATLMTRTRQWGVGAGQSVMLSDTVGFVRDLPHHLVASFKATLEETTHADLLLVVLDVSDPAASMQHETVCHTLDTIFEETARAEARAGRSWSPPARVTLLNKADRLTDNRELLMWQSRIPGAIPVSAVNPNHPLAAEGLERLTEAVRAAAAGPVSEVTLRAPLSDAKTILALESSGEVLDRAYENGSAVLRLRIGGRRLAQIRAGGGGFEVVEASATGAPESAAPD